MRFTLLSALPISIVAALSTAPANAGDDAGLRGRLETYLDPYDRAGQLSGTLLVARGDRILLERAYGFANRELGVLNTPDTRYCIASITKPMTIALVCRLAEEGKLSPQDSLARWIPDFPRARDITISHLLNHRAGIPHRVTESWEETVPRTAADMVGLAARKPLLFEPGEQSVYSSAGFSVLARVAELAGGKPYGVLLAENVFAPAGMTRSAHVDARTPLVGRAASYVHGPGGPRNAPLRDLSFLVGAGSVYSTPHDLFLMMRALLDGRLGEAAKIALLRENGLRWNGITNGFRAFADYYIDTDLIVIMTGNIHVGAVDRIREAVPKLAAGEDPGVTVVPAPEPISLSPDRLAGCEGHYRAGPGQEFDLSVEDGHLQAGDWFLMATSESTFFSPQDYGTVTLLRDGEGGVDGLVWIYSGGTLRWTRTGP